MKTPPISLLQDIGFTPSNYAQIAAYCAHILKAATQSSPALTLAPAVAARPAKPAVLAQPAHPAYPARPAISASANTQGYAFGALYLNSPAYPAGTAVPAIPAKAASAAVAAQPAQPAVAAVPARIAPEIKALNGMGDAIKITNHSDKVVIEALFPRFTNLDFVGSYLADSFFEKVREITPANLQPTQWFGMKASQVRSDINEGYLKPTVEELFVEAARYCANNGAGATIEPAMAYLNYEYQQCSKVTVTIAADMAKGYSPYDGILHLEAFSYYDNYIPGGGTAPISSPSP